MLKPGNEYDYVTRTSLNQGILQETGFVNQENMNEAGTWSLGLLQMDFFYRSKPWYAGQFVRKIVPKIDISEGSVAFFTVILNSIKEILLEVLVRNVDKTFVNTKVFLPTKNGEIDFEFMESFVAELEAQRVAELEAYLIASGLNDYELAPEEREVLNKFEELEWEEFKISDLFSVNSYKKRFDANKVTVLPEGKYPYIVRTALNNGLKGYINEDTRYLNDGNTISFGQDTATMFYQENPYFTGDKIKILKPKMVNFNKNKAHFLLASMAKSFSSFSWGKNSYSVKVIENQLIQLPIKHGKIDYNYIETFITAIKKLVIKDVVKWTDKKIELTKDVVNTDYNSQ